MPIDPRWTRRQMLATAAALAMTPAMAKTVPRPKITDAQVHIWQPGGKTPSPAGRQDPFSAEELLAEMDAAGVDRAVIVPPSWAARGNAYALESALAHPDRLKVAGLVTVPNPEDRAMMEVWRDTPGMAAMRMFLSFPAGAEWLASGAGDWLWPILAARRIPLMIHAGDSLDVLDRIAGDYPELPLCLDAFGLGRGADGQAAVAGFAKVAPLARHANVVVKTGPIPTMSTAPYPHADMQTLVQRALDAFGPDRLLFASDLTLMNVPYAQAVSFWSDVPGLSDTDRAKILGSNANRWLGWSDDG